MHVGVIVRIVLGKAMRPVDSDVARTGYGDAVGIVEGDVAGPVNQITD